MNLTSNTTVREWAVQVPNATRVFEKLGIDYCCGGKKSLGEACNAANLQIDEVLQALKQSAQPSSKAEQYSLMSGSLAELIDHIVKTHHKFTREETVRIQALSHKVASVHGKNHPELLTIRDVFAGLSAELQMHLMKEENVLFPYIGRMEEALMQDGLVVPPPFGTVENPIRMMTQEHDGAGAALQQIREASKDFSIPEDACISFRTLYQALEGFEADLHQHIHLENNILFPRAVAMENRAAVAIR